MEMLTQVKFYYKMAALGRLQLPVDGLPPWLSRNSLIHVFMDPFLLMLEEKGVILFPQSWEHEFVQNVLLS